MPDSDESAVPSAEPDEHRISRQLAAMRLLLSTDRDRHEADILLASIFETLEGDVARTTDELLIQVKRDWPAVAIPREKFEATLAEAETRGFLVRTDRLGGTAAWKCTDSTAAGVVESKSWADAVLERCRRQVADRALAQELESGFEQSQLWTTLLLDALHESITRFFDQIPASTREVSDKLFPPYDPEHVVAAVHQRVDDPVVSEFLSRCALAALDPGSNFGSEVVHYLATGYVLHAFLLQYDLHHALNETGPFEGEVLLLDTPVLLRLMSAGAAFRWTIDLVGSMAKRAGAQVAVTARTRVELDGLLESRSMDARRLEREMGEGLERDVLAVSTGDEVLAIWLADPAAPSWAEFKEGVGRLFATLRAVGVEVDYCPDGWAPESGRIELFTAAVQGATKARTGTQRRTGPAEHDGELLCLLEFLRSEREDDSAWPGAFIVTPDRSLNVAFATEADGVRVTLTVSQTAAILGRTASPSEAERMAELIANDQQWQTRFRRATAMGTEQSIELARKLMGSKPDDLHLDAVDVQMSFDEILAGADYDGDPNHAIRTALTTRERTRQDARSAHNREASAEVVRERERAVRAEESARVLKRELESSGRALGELHGQTSTLKDETEDLRILVRVKNRVITAVVLYAVAGMAVLYCALSGWLDEFVWIGPLAAMAATTKWVYDWVVDPEQRWFVLLIHTASWIGFAGLARVIADRMVA